MLYSFIKMLICHHCFTLVFSIMRRFFFHGFITLLLYHIRIFNISAIFLFSWEYLRSYFAFVGSHQFFHYFIIFPIFHVVFTKLFCPYWIPSVFSMFQYIFYFSWCFYEFILLLMGYTSFSNNSAILLFFKVLLRRYFALIAS